MIPIDHQAAALARVAQYLKGKPNFEGVLAALTASAQGLETAFLDLLNKRLIDSGEGAQLDVLGRIVGQDRGGLTDSDYRTFLRARILINNSSGAALEILKVYEILLSVLAPTMTVTLRDEPPAAFTLVFDSLTEGITEAEANLFVQILRVLKAGGVRAVMEFGTVANDGTFTFFFDAVSPMFDDVAVLRGALT